MAEPSAPTKTKEIVIKGKLTWGEYKRLVNPETPEMDRVALIEKYVECDDDVPFAEVMSALQQVVGITGQKK